MEQKVQPYRRPDELGQVGRHRDQLRLHPQAQDGRPGKVGPAQLRQVTAGGHADLRGQVLHQHRHQVGRHDHPRQRVPEQRPGGEVGGEVARVDVRDRGHERGPEQGDDAAHPAALTQQAQPALVGDRRAGRQRQLPR
jgi:hypothetical protein